MRRAAMLLLAACLAFAAIGSASALIPPWFAAANQAQACLAGDPQLNATVSALNPDTSGGYQAGLIVRVSACGAACEPKAQALATLVAPWARLRKFRLAVVYGNGSPITPGKTPEGQAQAAGAAAAALKGNRAFSRVAKAGDLAVVEFAPVALQYGAGDIGDVHGKTTKVAKDACAEVFGFAANRFDVSAGARGPA